MLKTNDEQELARRLAALEKVKPDGPYALRLLEKDPKEYQALKEVYEQAMADLGVAQPSKRGYSCRQTGKERSTTNT